MAAARQLQRRCRRPTTPLQQQLRGTAADRSNHHVNGGRPRKLVHRTAPSLDLYKDRRCCGRAVLAAVSRLLVTLMLSPSPRLEWLGSLPAEPAPAALPMALAQEVLHPLKLMHMLRAHSKRCAGRWTTVARCGALQGQRSESALSRPVTPRALKSVSLAFSPVCGHRAVSYMEITSIYCSMICAGCNILKY